MEGFSEEIQQQDSQVEEQEPIVAEATTESPAEPVAQETKVSDADRKVLNEEADLHRKKRDEFNALAKEWKTKRDALNGQVRELVDEAGKCREERDSYNQKVRETKELRDEWNQKVGAIKDQLAPYRTEKSEDKNEVPLKQLKKQRDDLLRIQETHVLADKERAIVKQISDLAKQIEAREKAFSDAGVTGNPDEIQGLVQQLKEAKEQAEVYHHQVSEHADKAQAAHDKMIGFYEQADRLRKEADAAQAEFVKNKQAADEEHRKHIEQIKSIHEIDKDAPGYRGNKKGGNRGTGKRHVSTDVEDKKEAKEIFERFKAGEKLSTEDLMALQKSGYL